MTLGYTIFQRFFTIAVLFQCVNMRYPVLG